MRRGRVTATVLATILAAAMATSTGAEAEADRRARMGAAGESPAAGPPMPWRQAGLSERQAAAHLLDRLTYGARPGDVDRVVAMGLERWLDEQLRAERPEPALDRRLARLPALEMPAAEIATTYVQPAVVLAEARRAGVLPEDFDPASLRRGEGDAATYRLRRDLLAFARQRGYRRQGELYDQLTAQKLWRAVYSENQLAELLTDFWFNHFNVSMTDNEARPAVLSYERDAIRPHALGSFRELLGATARHPAMLLYLDNARSVAAAGEPTTAGGEIERLRSRYRRRGGRMVRSMEMSRRSQPQRPNRPTGLNENYAREVLELHTLGVDGGYTQDDVVEVARAFSGWTVMPPGPAREDAETRLGRVERLGGLGFVRDGEFLFRADAHDAGAKRVLGRRLPAGRGIDDGEEVLDLLAAHPSTARHVATKLAVRLVSDQPPAALVERLAERFRSSGGDVRALVREVVAAPEFWGAEARAAKIKSPLELAASALRALDAELGDPRPTTEWLSRMGQPLYAYQAPTGYPDRGDFWVSTGSLLNRMSFGLELAAGEVRGARFDLEALVARGCGPAAGNGDCPEPASRGEALARLAPLLLPERELAGTVERLAPMAADPTVADRVQARLPARIGAAGDGGLGDDEAVETALFGPAGGSDGMATGDAAPAGLEAPAAGGMSHEALEQVLGVILGSPEFQRR